MARFEPGWLRFAPFTSAGLVLVPASSASAARSSRGSACSTASTARPIDQTVTGPARWSSCPAVLIVVAIVAAVFSVLGYLVTNGNFALSHTTPDGSWHVRRGLLTTRETSLDDDRLRGVALGEPWGLRLVRGGRLSAIVTGLKRSESGSSTLLPPAPRELVDRVAAEVVGSPAPVHAPLRDHGPRARPAGSPAHSCAGGRSSRGPHRGRVGPDLGWSRCWPCCRCCSAWHWRSTAPASLGHTLVDGWLVARSGSLTRKRELLATDAIIGWNLHSTWFQRRAGLVTLVATTAGGRQSVAVLDVPAPAAVAVADAAIPGLLPSSPERSDRGAWSSGFEARGRLRPAPQPPARLVARCAEPRPRPHRGEGGATPRW